MSLLLCWLACPLVLTLVAIGCGLLVEQAAGFRLPGALLAPAGVALVIVAGDVTTSIARTAQLATPLIVALAAAGYLLSAPWRGRRLDGWSLACAVAAFAAYAAPIVLTGRATFAGYITLDDTATWLALTGHVMEHGRAVAGLAPSTYELVLHDYLDGGYPLGAFMVLGVGGKLTGQDIAWLFQPTIAFYGAMLALTIYGSTARLVSSRPLRAVVAVLAAQPALLFAYALWSGIKELAAAAMIALVCVLVGSTLGVSRGPRSLLPAGLAVAALIAVLSPAGGVWLLIPAGSAVALLARRGLRTLLPAAGALLAFIAVLSVPSITIASKFLRGAAGGEITRSNEVANLGHPLDTLQMFGIWPATDFRTRPHDPTVTYALIAVLVVAGAVGLRLAWRKRALVMPLYLATGAVAIGVVLLLGHAGLSSPWLNAKAMAEASPALVAAALAGAAAVFETGRRTEAVIALAAVGIGVLWSNGLAYSNAWLAPRSQLVELQTIDKGFAGDGPTLMTEHQPYGVRHFLRNLAPEAASERRHRIVALRSGGYLATSMSADLDAFEPDAILVYRTLVLRRSPVESRPPAVYRLVWKGRWYEVWQRPQHARQVIEHLSLGDASDPAAVPRCAQVLRLAESAQTAGGVLATVARPALPVELDLTQGSHPAAWNADPGAPGTLVTHGGGTVSLDATVSRGGRYGLWLGGSFRRTITALVDGREAGSVSDQLNEDGQWTPLGQARIAGGSHTISLRYGGSRLAPGTGGLPLGMGPLILSTATADVPVTLVNPSDARSLCGRRFDWLEALGS